MRSWARTVAERTQEKERGGKLRKAGARAEFSAEVKRGLNQASEGQAYRNLGTIPIDRQWPDQVESARNRIGKKGPLSRSYTTEMSCTKIA